ncbi:hypothetical protein MACH09_11950 [Vibrio sp. MACH09]|uniref:EAL domain-containing protein n=1 Tax=Vibrio sp. MACH09 TaxID=3025122 RepID=UPI00279011E0|nr:EAL domain-containing protein [Vibrio sp. MACH09]GLO60687.1 hypothetical protein MACH09_11950 [Vibrio sp. MACH09]
MTLIKNVTRLICRRIVLIGLLLVGGPYSFVAEASHPSEQDVVYVQLRWHHQFQFAGYYAALEKGFYKQEGIDVQIRNGDPLHQPVSEVLSERAQYAVGNSEVLYQRLQGEPLIALASIFQHSPSVLLTRKSSGIRSVHDLIGKKVMLANKLEDADFLTMLLNEGVAFSQLNVVPSSYDLNDLINGNVDAFNSYITNEPYVLKQKNIEYNVIDPVSYSVDFYSDIFFTSEQEVEQHPERVKAMLRATLKGWLYAMENTDEIIDILKEKYHVKKSRDHLRYEAEEMRKLILPNLIQIGHMNPKRWQHMADTFIKAGLIDSDENLEGFVYTDNPIQLPRWIVVTLIAALTLLLLISSITFYLHRFNRQLALTQKTLQESEQRFKAISAATYGGIVIHDNGVVLECNEGLSVITGFSYQELIGINGLTLIAPEEVKQVLRYIHSGFADAYESIGIRKDGTRYPLSIKGKNITYKGKEARVIEINDITDRKKTEEQLRLAASVFTHAREGIMITNSAGQIVEVNETFSQITGYSRDEVIGKNPRLLSSGKHNAQFYREMWGALLDERQWTGEIWNSKKSGEVYAVLATISAVSDAHDNTKNYVSLFIDITPMKQHQQQLEHIALYDPLTSLPNRVLLAERLSCSMEDSQQLGLSVAVAYLDLDGFKKINDCYGHDVGDELLIKLSQNMDRSLREGDTLARIGGDEFVVVMGEIEKVADCELVLQRLLQAAMRPINIDGHRLQVSTSIGVTLYPQDGVDADLLMRHADQAMYVAKQTGKNRYHFFDINKDKSKKTQRRVIKEVKQALESNQFELYFQPKVNMRTGAVVGAEALIRWHHPERGLVYPMAFLPSIENHSISLQLGEWVIDSALAQMAEWQTEGLELPVSVNIDAFQLQQKDFVDRLAAALAAWPMVKPGLLRLEILETNELGDLEDVLKTMNACIDMGVSFALDDFGTGFSSLTYLKRLPVKVLKIDQSFVRDMLEDPDDREIVKGVISLASAFNRDVTAEGVESIEHGTQLLSMGCEYAQGYGIARPMPAKNMVNWVDNWRPATQWLQQHES